MTEDQKKPQMVAPEGIPPPDENYVMAARREKLERLREQGNAFPNTFRRDTLAEFLHGSYGERDAASLEAETQEFRVAGRLMAKRGQGKVSFVELQDSSGRIQLFVQQNALGEELYQAFKGWDVGDIVGAVGTLMRTKTGELSLRVTELQLLVKTVRPLPEKWAGLTDTEIRYRQRYVDLIVNPEVRATFEKRGQTVRFIRNFLDALGFVEVETPMLQPIAGGATAQLVRGEYAPEHGTARRDSHGQVLRPRRRPAAERRMQRLRAPRRERGGGGDADVARASLRGWSERAVVRDAVRRDARCAPPRPPPDTRACDSSSGDARGH